MADKMAESELMQTLDAVKYQDAVRRNQQRFPPLARHQFEATTGSGPGFSEFYPSFEKYNPRPGKNLIEVRELGQAMKHPGNIDDAMAGEMLHLLGTVDQSGKPVDPTFRQFKEQFMKSFTHEQLAIEQRLHKKRGDTRPFEQAFEHSESDAFIRSYLFPNVADPEYVKALKPEQLKILDKIKTYLETGKP